MGSFFCIFQDVVRMLRVFLAVMVLCKIFCTVRPILLWCFRGDICDVVGLCGVLWIIVGMLVMLCYVLSYCRYVSYVLFWVVVGMLL